MWIYKKILAASFLILPFSGLAQPPDSLLKKLDSLNEKIGSAGGTVNQINENAYTKKTRITVPTYFILLGSDLKQEFTAPFHFHKKDWVRAGEFALLTAGFAFADEPVQRFALDLHDHHKVAANLSSFITKFGGTYELYSLAAFGTYGIVFKNEKIKTATLLATQAYITGGVMESLLKFLTGRQRPSDHNVNANEVEPTFHGPFYKGLAISSTGFNSSFPSGHTTVAFAAATVFAMEYKDKPLIPVISYSIATLIGLSRITENAHWISDVFAGAVLGFLTGHQVVNNYHRYAKLKNSELKKNGISFNLQYNGNYIMPGLIYSFR